MARGGDITPQGEAFIQSTREKAVTAFFYRVLLLSGETLGYDLLGFPPESLLSANH